MMNGWAAIGVNSFLYAMGVLVISIYVRGVKKDVTDALDKQFKSCSNKFDRVNQDSREQLHVIDTHSHRGLDGAEGQVVRR